MIRQENGVFCVETRNTGYYIAPRGPLAEQLHYGRKIRPSAEVLRQPVAVAYGTDVIYDKETDPNLSLLHLGLELSPTEKGDFRRGALNLTLGNGSRVCDLRFAGAEILPQPPETPGLPTARESGECLVLRFESGEGVLAGNGSRVCDLRFAGAEILPQPPETPGLPTARESGECLVLRFESGEGVLAELCYIPFEDCDVILRQLRLTNRTDGPVTLHRAMSYQLDLPRQDLLLTTLNGAWAREFEPSTTPVRPGLTSFGSVSGTSSHYCNPFFALSAPDTGEHTGEIYGFNLIYSGSHGASVEMDCYGFTRVMAGIQEEGFGWTLQPGECFVTPQAVLTFSGEGRNGLRYNMHRFVTEHILPPRWREEPRPVLVNNWEATYFDFTPRKLKALAAKAAGLGAELFVLDDGWFGRRTDDTRGLGDFDPNQRPPGWARSCLCWTTAGLAAARTTPGVWAILTRTRKNCPAD